MYELIKVFFDITLLKKGPQDVPGVPILLVLLIVVNLAVNLLLQLLSSDWWGAIQQVMVELVLLLVFTRLLLAFFAKSVRFQQTASALLGTDCLLTIFAFPAIASLTLQGSLIAFIIIVLMILWHWVVTGHIFKQAISQSYVFALGIAFLYFLLNYLARAWLFPELDVSTEGDPTL